MNKATIDTLSRLHERVAQSMVDSLEHSGTAILLFDKYAKDKSIPSDIKNFLAESQHVSPALLQAITKFLKDNDITVDPSADSSLNELDNVLRNRRKASVSQIPFE